MKLYFDLTKFFQATLLSLMFIPVAEAAELESRFESQRKEIVERLESYAKAVERANKAVNNTESALALAQELDDAEALEIAKKARLNSQSALRRL